jgi:hypothetical protein
MLQAQDVVLDPAARSVTLAGAPVALSPREFDLLHALMLAAGRVLSREQLEQQLYSWGQEVESNAVEVHIHHLRRKLGRRSSRPCAASATCVPREAAGMNGCRGPLQGRLLGPPAAGRRWLACCGPAAVATWLDVTPRAGRTAGRPPGAGRRAAGGAAGAHRDDDDETAGRAHAAPLRAQGGLPGVP